MLAAGFSDHSNISAFTAMLTPISVQRNKRWFRAIESNDGQMKRATNDHDADAS
jgi:hypothetical protein